jgi:hypothetical protein
MGKPTHTINIAIALNVFAQLNGRAGAWLNGNTNWFMITQTTNPYRSPAITGLVVILLINGQAAKKMAAKMRAMRK